MCDRFVDGASTVENWRREILSDAPHILIYPGLLMDRFSVQLAAQRLAPVQCNSWGHPETSGMPTLDYYLSSDLMEPQTATEHYTEQLVRLPNLSIYYEPIETEPVSISRAELGLRSDATVFWSGQALFKYLPQFDHVFANIANLASNCQFVFLRHEGLQRITELFQQRLDRAFAALDLKASNHCVFVDRLSNDKFVAAIGQCDVFLDTIGWSGCNSLLESLVHNLPIVTTPGPLMRGRHGAAILQMMGITETIADTVKQYISIAARLANQPDERRALSRTIAERKHRLYHDRACISALEEFLDRTARQQQV
jgi:predicted O-linked N-acetylglucosamine transferase (SPINDLY family)